MLQTYGSNASVEDTIRSTEGIVAQQEADVKRSIAVNWIQKETL